MAKFTDAFRSWRVGVMLLLGFGSGLPNPLTGATLTAWMRSVDVDLATIGAFALVSLPYNLKFLWAPLMDRYRLPFLDRRRGWMLLLQGALLLSSGLLGSVDPRGRPSTLAALALLVAFLSASNDIVTDAYRTDVLAPQERGSGTAVFVMGYRMALIASTAGALILSDHLSWRLVYWGMAALMLIGMAGTLLAPAPRDVVPAPASLRDAVVAPLAEILGRERVAGIIVVVLLYKVGDAVASHLLTPFLLDVGFGRSEIGAVQKGLGLAATIVGALVGGGLLARLGLRRSLIAFGLLQAGANTLYIVLARAGANYVLFVWAVGVDSLCGGLGTAAFVALMMSLCDPRYTAFQYALVSSASSLGGRVLSVAGGWLAERFGWPTFFAVTIAAAAPALALLLRVPLTEQGARHDR